MFINQSSCEISVRILWRNVWNYSNRTYNTLIICLPNESKELLFHQQQQITNVKINYRLKKF